MDNEMRRFETVNDYNVFNRNTTLHPLVSVVDLSKAGPRQGSRMYFGFYTIFLKDVKCGDLTYGKENYDYQEGTLVFLAPGIWQQRDWARPVGDGVYEMTFTPPQPGAYYVFFQSPSLKVKFNQLQPATLEVVGAVPKTE